jgi:hypothetical protein
LRAATLRDAGRLEVLTMGELADSLGLWGENG